MAELPTDDDQWEGSDKEPQSEAKPGGFCAGSCIIKFAAISLGGFHNSILVKSQTFGDMLFYCIIFFTKALAGKPIEFLKPQNLNFGFEKVLLKPQMQNFKEIHYCVSKLLVKLHTPPKPRWTADGWGCAGGG